MCFNSRSSPARMVQRSGRPQHHSHCSPFFVAGCVASSRQDHLCLQLQMVMASQILQTMAESTQRSRWRHARWMLRRCWRSVALLLRRRRDGCDAALRVIADKSWSMPQSLQVRPKLRRPEKRHWQGCGPGYSLEGLSERPPAPLLWSFDAKGFRQHR